MSRMTLGVSPYGVHREMVDNNDGTFSVVGTQHVADILDRNQAMANENDGYSASRELRRVASIPISLIQHWRDVEGWDAFDPANHDRLVRVLNDPDFRLLRTAPGQIGYTNGVMR